MKLVLVNDAGTVIHTVDLDGTDLTKPLAKADLVQEVVSAWQQARIDRTFRCTSCGRKDVPQAQLGKEHDNGAKTCRVCEQARTAKLSALGGSALQRAVGEGKVCPACNARPGAGTRHPDNGCAKALLAFCCDWCGEQW